MPKPARKPASEPVPPSVKTSVPLPVETHAKLAWWAAATGQERGAIAARLIADGVRHIVVSERGKDDATGNGAGGA